MNVADLPPVLTVEEFARFARVGRAAAYEAVRRGQVPSLRIANRIRIPRRALLELLGETDPTPNTREPDLSRAQDSRDDYTSDAKRIT